MKGRIFKGQLNGRPGEEELTNMEQLDDLALAKVGFLSNESKKIMLLNIFSQNLNLKHKNGQISLILTLKFHQPFK
jgi:hypothetical protein